MPGDLDRKISGQLASETARAPARASIDRSAGRWWEAGGPALGRVPSGTGRAVVGGGPTCWASAAIPPVSGTAWSVSATTGVLHS